MIQDQLLKRADEQQLTLATREPQVPILNKTPIADNVLPGNAAAPRVQSATTVASRQTRYRPLPTKTKPSIVPSGTRKRKHASKGARPIQNFDDFESDNDSDKGSGDGTSSGNSVHSDAACAKQQKISQVVTRSSIRNIFSRTPGSASLLPSTTIHTEGTVGTNTDDVVGTDADTDGIMRTDTDNVARIDTDVVVRANAKDVVGTNTDDAASTDTDVIVRAGAKNVVSTNTDDVASTNAEDAAATDTPTTAPRVSSQMSLDNIDVATIPALLLQHGTGKRRVNIFNYLKSLKDPHFQPVLFHYLRLMINQSELDGSLPTAKRPREIGLWSSRARPPCLPDYKKNGRTFADFVDSIFVWWGSIQPSWRVFERGKVAREVDGEWDVLHAFSINGLLNVVMLVYWWARVLEEDEPEGGMRTEYEFLADDVAWVLSHILLE